MRLILVASDEIECEYDDEVEEYWDVDFDGLCEDFNTNTLQPSITDDLPSDHSYNYFKQCYFLYNYGLCFTTFLLQS